MKQLVLLFLFAGFSSFSFAQYTVDFNSGLPSDWTQTSGADFTWVLNASQGFDNSGCAMVDQSGDAAIGSAKFETPFFDLSGESDPVFRFVHACLRNNFMPPVIRIHYNTGSGWTEIGATGEFGGSADFSPPLDDESIIWDTLEISLVALSSETHVQFMIEADFPNGGWALLDNVSIDGVVSTLGITETTTPANVLVYPNPTHNKLFITGTAVQSVSILDVNGRLIAVPEVAPVELSIDVSHLGAGCYFLAITANEGKFCIPFMVKE